MHYQFEVITRTGEYVCHYYPNQANVYKIIYRPCIRVKLYSKHRGIGRNYKHWTCIEEEVIRRGNWFLPIVSPKQNTLTSTSNASSSSIYSMASFESIQRRLGCCH